MTEQQTSNSPMLVPGEHKAGAAESVNPNQTGSFAEALARLIKERERLNLSQSQFACLAGVSSEEQASLEAGKWDVFPMNYLHGAQQAGADPLFILGHSPEPKTFPAPTLAFGSPLFPDDAFLDAVTLLRKSVEAVKAFAGDTAADQCPQLVAALMQATINTRSAKYACGAGDMEDLANKVSDAISQMGEAIADALNQDTVC